MTETEGLLVRSTGSWYEVLMPSGEIIPCRLKGVFRLEESMAKDSNPLAVGDRLLVAQQEGDHVITQLLPRRNYLIRSSPKHRGARHIIASNLDQAVLLVTMAQPRTSMGFIDRFLLSAEAYHIPTLLVFNKSDLLDGKGRGKQEAMAGIYRKVGYEVLECSAATGVGVEEVSKKLQGKTSLLSGHSGVGKSSLLNVIDPSLELRTSEVSRITGKGMHTTTFATMHFLKAEIRIIDTPGIREFGITDFEPQEISHYYLEMREALPGCRFNNCLHENEPGCAVKEAVEKGSISTERYQSYLHILQDYRSQYLYWEK
jgi:ribosome biogenesis GTPase